MSVLINYWKIQNEIIACIAESVRRKIRLQLIADAVTDR